MFRRAFTWCDVRQLEKTARGLPARLAARTPGWADAGTLALLDVDTMRRRTYGYAKQGSGFGVRGSATTLAGRTELAGKSVLVHANSAFYRSNTNATTGTPTPRKPNSLPQLTIDFISTIISVGTRPSGCSHPSTTSSFSTPPPKQANRVHFFRGNP